MKKLFPLLSFFILIYFTLFYSKGREQSYSNLKNQHSQSQTSARESKKSNETIISDKITLRHSSISKKINSNNNILFELINEDDLVECENGETEICLNILEALYEKKQYLIAYDLLKDKCHFNYQTSSLCFYLGKLATEINKNKEALRFFMFGCVSEIPNSCLQAGIIKKKLKDHEVSKDLIQKGCDLGSSSSCGWLAFSEMEDENNLKALKLSQKLCGKKHMDYTCYVAAKAYQKNGNQEEALRYYKKSCQGKYFWACREEGLIEKKRGNYKKALKLMDLACKEEVFYSCFDAATIEKERGNTHNSKRYLEIACSKPRNIKDLRCTSKGVQH